jgi:AAA+ ATPase superfamily predicted ATPase
MIMMRGRRQVGKSTLVEQWLQKNTVKHVFFTASKAGTDQNLRAFTNALKESNLNQQGFYTDIEFTSWEAILKQVAGRALSSDPSVVVIDELPYIVEKDQSFTSVIQQVWEDTLKKKPVLLILIGSDIHMMEELGLYDQPLYQRARELVVKPFTPHQALGLLKLPPEQTLEAYLITGGLEKNFYTKSY